MPHAMHVVATVVPGRRAESLSSLENHTIPWVRSASGFVKGLWWGDESVGHGLVVFEAEEDARAAARLVGAGPDDPVQIQSVTVYEVNAEA